MHDIKFLSKILQPKQMINRDVKLGCKHSFSSAFILYRHINFTYPKAYRYKIIYKLENLRLQKFIFFLLRKNENYQYNFFADGDLILTQRIHAISFLKQYILNQD